MSNIGKRAVSIVMKEAVMPQEATEKVVPSIVVVIAHADAGLPSGQPQAGLFCDIRKRAITVIFVQM